LWSILCSILPYLLRIKKKTIKDIELFNQFFTFAFHFFHFKTFSGKVEKWFFHFFHFHFRFWKVKKSLFHFSRKSEKRKLLFFAFQCMDANYTNLIFSIYFLSIFNHLNSINVLFFNFYNSMEHFRLHFFIIKPLYIQWY